MCPKKKEQVKVVNEATTPLEMRTLITNNFDLFQAFGVTSISYSFTTTQWTISYKTGRKIANNYWGGTREQVKRISKPTLAECIAEFNIRLQEFAKQRQRDLQLQATEARNKAIKAQKEAQKLEQLSKTLELQAKQSLSESDGIVVVPTTPQTLFEEE